VKHPNCTFCQWVGSFKKVLKSWCFKLSEKVIILNKPANSCQLEALGIEASKLISYLLRHAVVAVFERAL
jgi:hypothetical protein